MSSSQSHEFAHRALPAVTFADPSALLVVLASPAAPAALADLWRQAGEHAGASSPYRGNHRIVDLGGPGVLALVELPAPEEPGDAFFVGILALFADPAAPSLQSLAAVRVFTLEKAAPITPGVVAYCCEWTVDATHANHGGLAEATDAAFVAAVVAAHLRGAN